MSHWSGSSRAVIHFQDRLSRYCRLLIYHSPKLEQLKRLHSEIPPATPWLPIQVTDIRSEVKRRQSQSYKFEKIAKNSNFKILQEILHATHLLKLLDKMFKYEISGMQCIHEFIQCLPCCYPDTDPSSLYIHILWFYGKLHKTTVYMALFLAIVLTTFWMHVPTAKAY